MNFKVSIVFLLLCTQILWAQDGFQFDSNKNRTSIPFQFINNLVIIPIEVNGISLNFLLDTGVEDSILFSVDDTDGVSFSNVEKIKIRGFGNKESFDAYKSIKNKLAIKNYTDLNHTIYLVLDQNINISSKVGIPVNGIIGYQFFKNNLVKINYDAKRITIYKNYQKTVTKIKKSYTKIPLELISGKPYLITKSFFENNSKSIQTKLLLDTGNSDALWFFKQKNDSINVPKLNLQDFLGRGFSGDVFGKRGKITALQIGDFTIQSPLAAFPDTSATSEIDKIEGRLGSVGSEIMKRFTTIYDYKSNAIYIKKNAQFNEPFNFNMSGLEIQHQGLQWIKQDYENNPAISNNLFDANGNKVANNLQYKFELKPIYIIDNIRKDSPADLAGFQKEDILVKIDKKNAYNYTLQQINDLLKSEDEKTIEFEIDRNGKILKFKIQLKNIL